MEKADGIVPGDSYETRCFLTAYSSVEIKHQLVNLTLKERMPVNFFMDNLEKINVFF